MSIKFMRRRRRDDEQRKPVNLEEAREAWRDMYHAAHDLARAAESLPADYMSDTGIQKFSMLVMGKLLAAQSQVHMVCAAGIAAPTREVPE